MISSIIILGMKGKSLFLLLFFVFSVLLSTCLLLHQQAPQFTFTHRDFHPSLPAVLFVTTAGFVLLLTLWVLYSKLASRLFARDESDVLRRDFLTFLPLLFLSLAPLTLRHYIGTAPKAQPS